MSKPVAWSHSVLDSFETCARRHYFTKVSKEVVEQQSEQMLHGNRVHKALENRVKDRTPLPMDMSHYEPIAARLIASARGGEIHAEQKLALNARFEPRTFFAKDVWVRAITDVTVIQPSKRRAFIGDYKTGNPKPNSAQLRLSAAVTFACLPYVDTITNSFIWLKTGEVTKETFQRADVPAIWQELMPRVQRLEQAHAEQKWPPKPSGLCARYCPVPRHKCEYSGGR